MSRPDSDEQAMLRETVAALVAKHASPAAVRAAIESPCGYDESLWRLLCEQVGAAALVVPEEQGGAGGVLGDAAVVIEELGKALVPTPLLGTTLAELTLLAADDADTDALEQLAAGEAIGAVVFDPYYVVNGDIADIVVAANGDKLTRWTAFTAEPVAPMDPTRRLARLAPQSSVPVGADPGVADIVVAANGDELSRWTAFTAEPLAAMDPTRRLARLAPQSSVPLGADPGVADAAAILLAFEQIGAATRCLELTVDYTKERVQFARPIGSFQALKHRMADLYVLTQAARAVVSDAVCEPSATSAALARVAASEAFSAVAAEGIQLHGGIAITWEHDMQLYFKRAHGSAQLLGAPGEHLRRLEPEVFAQAHKCASDLL